MKRRELLEKGENKNFTEIIEADKKFLKRRKRDLEDRIEDLELELKNRLRSEVPLDLSVVEVTYAEIQNSKKNLELYTQFEEAHL